MLARGKGCRRAHGGLGGGGGGTVGKNAVSDIVHQVGEGWYVTTSKIPAKSSANSKPLIIRTLSVNFAIP